MRNDGTRRSAAKVTSTIPFFPPDLFEEDRQFVLDLVHDIALDPAQKFILGRRVEELERRICEESGTEHAVACASGTGALELAVRALGIGLGDEVIVPAFCCQPVASSVVNVGATPIFADIDPLTMVIDPSEVERLISPATKAIMPAHVFSVMADMPRIMGLAEQAGVRIIEDAAVAQGAVMQGRAAGTWGDIGVFSFFQVKALGSIGEGGMVLSDNGQLANVCRLLRNHGQAADVRGIHHLVGENNRMDELLAGFLVHRYDGLQARLRRRADIAAYYNERFSVLADLGLRSPPHGQDGRCYYVYSVLCARRDALRAHLESVGIGTHVYYPLPLPRQPAFSRFANGERFPRAEAAGEHNLALPIFPHLIDAEVERIADEVVGFLMP